MKDRKINQAGGKEAGIPCEVLDYCDAGGTSTKTCYQILPGVRFMHLTMDLADMTFEEDTAGTDAGAHEFIEIGCCRSGRMEILESSGKTVLSPGDVTIHEHVLPHGKLLFPDHAYEALSILIEQDRAPEEVLDLLRGFDLDLKSIKEHYHLAEQNVYVLRRADRIAGAFEQIFCSLGREDVSYQRIRVMEILLLVRDSCKGTDVPGRTATSISAQQYLTAREVREYLEQNPEKNTTIAELAHRFSSSPTQLKQGFRAVYGQTIHTFAKKMKMQAAAQTLVSEDLSVRETAEKYGYINAGKFSAAFRSCYGETPLHYRKRQRLLSGGQEVQ